MVTKGDLLLTGEQKMRRILVLVVDVDAAAIFIV